ncbi:MAG: hypothetical protein VYD64_00395 [Pseudomonadota bacterium]|nr:hypothetical protein [Pseudomonadota bacterium]
MKTGLKTILLVGALTTAGMAHAADGGAQGMFELAQACGWYAIVGCTRSWNGTQSIAPQGTSVIDTNLYPNFSNGWFCAADGPYARRDDVPIWHWKQFRADAYVKSAC